MSEIITIDGEIEVLSHYFTAPGGTRYKFIRFHADDGRVLMLKNIGVGDDGYSYLQPGLKGRFCYCSLGLGANSSMVGDLAMGLNFLLGIKANNRIVVESDRKLIFMLKIINACFIPFAILASIFVIGIPWLILSASVLFSITPSKTEVQQVLNSF